MAARTRRDVDPNEATGLAVRREGQSASCWSSAAWREVCAVIAVVLSLTISGCAGEDTDPGEPPSTGSSSSWLDSLSLDSGGWSHSTQLRDLGHGDPVGLAATDDAVVALVEGETPGAYRSTDGLGWQPAEGFPVTAGGGCPPTVAGGPMGFVAAGVGGRETPVLAYSADGLRWEEVDPTGLPTSEVAWFGDVFAGPDGFLAFATVGTSDDLGSSAWFSPDGRTWTTSDLALAGANSVAATGDGWMAVTGADVAVRVDEPDVWTSEDGWAWVASDIVSPPAQAALGAYCGTAPLAVVGDIWALTETEGRHDVVVWGSDDGGVTWDQRVVVDVPSGGEQRVNGLVAGPSGLFLIGAWDDSRDGDHHTYLAHSTDGASWEVASSTDTEEISQVATMGDTLVLLADDLETHVWNAP